MSFCFKYPPDTFLGKIDSLSSHHSHIVQNSLNLTLNDVYRLLTITPNHTYFIQFSSLQLNFSSRVKL